MWLFMRVILHVGVHAGLVACGYSCIVGYIYMIDVLLKCLTSFVYVCM